MLCLPVGVSSDGRRSGGSEAGRLCVMAAAVGADVLDRGSEEEPAVSVWNAGLSGWRAALHDLPVSLGAAGAHNCREDHSTAASATDTTGPITHPLGVLRGHDRGDADADPGDAGSGHDLHQGRLERQALPAAEDHHARTVCGGIPPLAPFHSPCFPLRRRPALPAPRRSAPRRCPGSQPSNKRSQRVEGSCGGRHRSARSAGPRTRAEPGPSSRAW